MPDQIIITVPDWIIYAIGIWFILSAAESCLGIYNKLLIRKLTKMKEELL